MPAIKFPSFQLPKDEDPRVMYLVVRESLGMGPGKIAAQCAHAAQLLTDHCAEIRMSVVMGGPSTVHPEANQLCADFGSWITSGFRKVVVRADDKEWEKIKACPDLHYVVVCDLGLTEVAAGSETVIGVWPRRRGEMPPWWRRLQAVK